MLNKLLFEVNSSLCMYIIVVLRKFLTRRREENDLSLVADVTGITRSNEAVSLIVEGLPGIHKPSLN